MNPKALKYTWMAVLLFLTVTAVGQDTLTIYFPFGVSKLQPEARQRLESIPTLYELSTLDSVHFVGRADSVGRSKANLKLSRKRAKNTASYCREFLPVNGATQIFALGEAKSQSAAKSRRVEVVLFFRSVASDSTDFESEPDTIPEKGGCYNIDYQLLQAAHHRVIRKGKKQVVLVETESSRLRNTKIHYYNARDAKGNFRAKRVRWSKKSSGLLWWKRQRYVATIPLESFESHKIFTKTDPPCKLCGQDFVKEPVLKNRETCLRADLFLQDNMKYRRRFFRRSRLKIKVPRAYVDLNTTYYAGKKSDEPVLWKTRRGRKRKLLYFAKITLDSTFVPAIKRQIECCPQEPEVLGGFSISCGTHRASGNGYSFGIEVGSLLQLNELTGYAALGGTKNFRIGRVSLLGGVDSRRSFYGSSRLQFDLFTFHLSALNPFETWVRAGKVFAPGRRTWTVYAGTELKTRINAELNNYLEQNLHLGLAYNFSKENTHRLFIQTGLGTDYWKNIAETPYGILQVGLQLRLFKF